MSCQASDAPGSSPRGRGKQYVAGFASWACGLIPARAGKTARATHAASSCSAHPRAGGENGTTFAVNWVAKGSSPRGRGKLGTALNADRPHGLIPA